MQLNERALLGLAASFVIRPSQEDERVSPGLIRDPPDLRHPELVAIEVQAPVDIGDPDHRVQVLHGHLRLRRRSAAAVSRLSQRQGNVPTAVCRVGNCRRFMKSCVWRGKRINCWQPLGFLGLNGGLDTHRCSLVSPISFL
jgi:hypothetical protein